MKNNKKNIDENKINYDNTKQLTLNDKEYERKKSMLTSFFLDKKYEPMTFEQICYIFAISKEQKEMIKNILDQLLKENLVSLDNGKKYISIKKVTTFECKYIAINSKEGYAVNMSSSNYVFYVQNTSGLIDGDYILVKPLSLNYIAKNGDKYQLAKIIKILKRNTEYVYGRYDSKKKAVIPLDKNISNVHISKKNKSTVSDNQLVKIKLLDISNEKNKGIKFKANRDILTGQVLDVIGNSNDEKAELEALFMSFELDKKLEIDDKVQKELLNIPDSINKEDEKNRVDKTNDRLYTIDASDAMDLDDAVGIKKQGNKYILSVCIADVSHYVKNLTNLDEQAILKGTSIYIPGTVIPMLPKKLSNGICSLNQNQKRLSLGIDITYDKNGNVIESNVYKAVIKVAKKMSYDKVYKVILGKDKEVLTEYKDYISDILLMKELALILKNKRKEEGSLDFDIPETQVVLDENHNLKDIKAHDINIANNMIEEFMLAANKCIAEKFFFLQAPFIYRIHEVPDEEKLHQLNEVLANYHLRVKGIKNIHAKALADILDKINDPEQKQIISKLMLRTLKLAKYSDQCVGHFAIAAKYYCHFTSPIRRYPDLFIHRVITDYIDNNYVIDENKYDMYRMQAKKYAKIASEMEKNATKIERAFDDIYMAIYMKDRIGQIYNASISNITKFGMFVRLDNTVEGLVPFSKMDDYYEYDDKKYRLIGRRKGKVFKIGDKVKVKVIRSDIKTRKIDFTIV